VFVRENKLSALRVNNTVTERGETAAAWQGMGCVGNVYRQPPHDLLMSIHARLLLHHWNCGWPLLSPLVVNTLLAHSDKGQWLSTWKGWCLCLASRQNGWVGSFASCHVTTCLSWIS